MLKEFDVQFALIYLAIGLMFSSPSVMEAMHRINTRVGGELYEKGNMPLESTEEIDWVKRSHWVRALHCAVASCFPTWNRIIEPYNALAVMTIAPMVFLITWRIFRAIRW